MTTADELGCPPVSTDPMAPFKLLNFILIMFISVVGLVGNFLVILTFHRQKRKTSATTFLKHLAAFDMLLIIATNLFAHRYAYTLVLPLQWVNHLTSGKLTIAILPISYICQGLSTWTIVAVALDRYIHVCHPLKAMKWCKIPTARKIIIAIIIKAVLYNIPRFFEYYKILEVASEAIDQCTGYFITPKDTLGSNDVYQYTYAFGLYMAIMYAFPLGSLLFFNINLIRKLNNMTIPGANGEVKKLSGSDKLLPSLIAVVTIFLICQVPDMVLQILWRTNSPSAPTFSIIAYDFIIINSSINFIVYVVAANGFRKSLITNVLPCLARLTRGSDDLTTSHTPSQKPRRKNSYTAERTSNFILSEASKLTDMDERNWKQSYTNPEPVEENSEPTNDVINKKVSRTASIWIGGSRRPIGLADVETPEGAPADTTLPDGTKLGVTGVYIVTKDPLLLDDPEVVQGDCTPQLTEEL